MGSQINQVQKDNQIKSRPWLTPQGRLYGDEMLREISESWDSETWEQFLAETVERPLKEIPVDPSELDRVEEERLRAFWEQVSSTQVDGDISAYVRRVIRDHLTPKQQHLIHLIFWEGLSEAQVAERMCLSRRTVPGLKKEILCKLRKLLERHPSISALSRDNQLEGGVDASESISAKDFPSSVV